MSNVFSRRRARRVSLLRNRCARVEFFTRHDISSTTRRNRRKQNVASCCVRHAQCGACFRRNETKLPCGTTDRRENRRQTNAGELFFTNARTIRTEECGQRNRFRFGRPVNTDRVKSSGACLAIVSEDCRENVGSLLRLVQRFRNRETL